MSTTDRQRLGRFGEDAVTSRYAEMGFSVVARNLHFAHNEIDLIAINKEYILFVEVKTRSASLANDLYLPYGTPAAAVDRKKQLRTVRAAQAYLLSNGSKGKQPRMDVIEVYLDKYTGKTLKINHIPDAFGA